MSAAVVGARWVESMRYGIEHGHLDLADMDEEEQRATVMMTVGMAHMALNGQTTFTEDDVADAIVYLTDHKDRLRYVADQLGIAP